MRVFAIDAQRGLQAVSNNDLYLSQAALWGCSL